MDKRPLGVFDSGLGGLSVVKEIKRHLPYESIVYLGDTARVPYGTRSKKTVTEFSLQCIKFLLKRKVKCIVVACNTSSAQAFDEIKKVSTVPTFEVIGPGVRAAVKNGKAGVIGVIGTRGTVKSSAYKKKINKHNSSLRVVEVACPLFVPLIEEGELKGKLIELCTQKYLRPLKRKGLDTLILGCTHYPLIKPVIAKHLDSKVRIVDSGQEVANQLSVYLRVKKMLADKNVKPKDEFYVTDLTERFMKVASMFLGKDLGGRIKKVELD